MTLHLIKLCVGVDSLETLSESQHRQAAAREREEGRAVTRHITRMVPRRREELLDGGSLYWVIKGYVRARQPLLDVREIVDDEGRRACVLEKAPTLIRVQPRAHRPFQGWRYLAPAHAPPDMSAAPEGVAEMPEWMVAELKELGLL